MKNLKVGGGDDIFLHVVAHSLRGHDVLHFAHEYPNEQAALCGQRLGDTWQRAPDASPDLVFTVCGECLKLARRKRDAKIMHALNISEEHLQYLRSLVRMDIRSKERGLAKFAPMPGQSEEEATATRKHFEERLAFRRAAYAGLGKDPENMRHAGGGRIDKGE